LNPLTPHIESLLFVADQAVPLEDIQTVLQESFDQKFSEEDILQAIDDLQLKLDQTGSAIELVEIAGGYQLLTRGAFHNTISRYLRLTSTRKLTRPALETLAIIAYKQPVTKSALEQIRGVNCDYTIQKLLEKELVEISGREEGPGRPLLYGTTTRFMDYFGLKSISDLPKPKEFKLPDNEIGQAESIDAKQLEARVQPAHQEEE
jgi:segregation and condensation protein B